MSKWAANTSSWVEPEIGNEAAICIRIIDLGTQMKEYQGKQSWKRQAMIVWELPGQLDGDGKPLTISKFYTASLGDKANLRHDLENWRGRPFTPEELKGFEQKNILGKPCLLNLIQNDKGKVVVGSVSAIPKGFTVPPQAVHECFIYSLDEHDEAIWDKLSDGIKGLIMKSKEKSPQLHAAAAPTNKEAAPVYEGSQPADLPPDEDDIIPF